MLNKIKYRLINLSPRYDINKSIIRVQVECISEKTYLLVGVGLAWATQGMTTVSFRRADMYTNFSLIIGGMEPRISAK